MTTKPKPIEEVLADLQTLTVAELVERYEALYGKPPRNKNRRWLFRRCAWREQENRYGGLSVTARRRIAELQAEMDLPPLPGATPPRTPRRAGEPKVGTRLEREWRGRAVVAIRRENGWEVEGTVHRSLSAAAKAITSSHVSGPAFFGLKRRAPR